MAQSTMFYFALCFCVFLNIYVSFAEHYSPVAPIVIEREDDTGIIHIRAENEKDLWYGQGRAMAQERLWQLDFQRKAIKGELASILGFDNGFANDIMMATLGFWNASQEAANRINGTDRDNLVAFISGINDYIASRSFQNLPLEFQALRYTPDLFTIADVVLSMKYLSMVLSGNYQSELFRFTAQHVGVPEFVMESLFPAYSERYPTTLTRQDVQKMGRFSHKFAPLPPPRFKVPATGGSTRNAQERRTENSPAFKKFTLEDILNPKDGFSWTKRPSFITPASNFWVVSGSRTVSRKPLLMNDPHLPISLPSIWVLFTLTCPTLNATGSSAVGVPGIAIGRNDKVAWGITNTGSDVQDVFQLQVEQATNTYVHENQHYDFVYRQVPIKIRNLTDGSFTVYNHYARETLYGPVISDIMDNTATFGNTLALHWTSLNHVFDPTISVFQVINKIQNFQEMRAVVKKYVVAPSQNLLYADTQGNIGYQCIGNIPVRKRGNGQFVVPGTGEYDWKGYIKFEELPYTYNPVRGFISNANNKIVPKSYPYLILNDYDWATKYRIERIDELLQKTRKHTVETMKAIQTDQKSNSWSDMRPILAFTQNRRLNSTAIFWKIALLSWKGDANVNDPRATVYGFWMYELGKIAKQFTWYDSIFEPTFVHAMYSSRDPARIAAATDAFQTAVNFLLQQNNNTIPKWGDVQSLHANHPLGAFFGFITNRSVKRGGDGSSVNVAPPSESMIIGNVSNPFATETFGPSYRQIIDLSAPDMKSVFALPGGESGNFTGPYYSNLLPGYAAGEYYHQRIHSFVAKTVVEIIQP